MPSHTFGPYLSLVTDEDAWAARKFPNVTLFFADWCDHCKAFPAVLDAVGAAWAASGIAVYGMNADLPITQHVVADIGVAGIPHVRVYATPTRHMHLDFAEGAKRDKSVDVRSMTAAQLVAWKQAFLASAAADFLSRTQTTNDVLLLDGGKAKARGRGGRGRSSSPKPRKPAAVAGTKRGRDHTRSRSRSSSSDASGSRGRGRPRSRSSASSVSSAASAGARKHKAGRRHRSRSHHALEGGAAKARRGGAKGAKDEDCGCAADGDLGAELAVSSMLLGGGAATKRGGKSKHAGSRGRGRSRSRSRSPARGRVEKDGEEDDVTTAATAGVFGGRDDDDSSSSSSSSESESGGEAAAVSLEGGKARKKARRDRSRSRSSSSTRERGRGRERGHGGHGRGRGRGRDHDRSRSRSRSVDSADGKRDKTKKRGGGRRGKNADKPKRALTLQNLAFRKVYADTKAERDAAGITGLVPPSTELGRKIATSISELVAKWKAANLKPDDVEHALKTGTSV